jgi:hypothetical protein
MNVSKNSTPRAEKCCQTAALMNGTIADNAKIK